jgi:hypothetical protein
LSITESDTHYHRARFHLTQATEQILDATINLQQFSDQTRLWAEVADVAAPTVAALVERRAAIETVRSAVKRQFASLAAEGVLLDAAWKTHTAAMRQVPRAQPVSADRRISAALAARFEDAEDDAAMQAIYSTLEDLGLAPEGPGWAQWGLEVRYGQLHWAPYLPPEPETPPVWPQSIEPAIADAGPAEAADENVGPAADDHTEAVDEGASV